MRIKRFGFFGRLVISQTCLNFGAPVHNLATTGGNIRRAGPIAMASPKPRLILHLDVNKTLVMSDVAGGKSIYAILNESIAELVWGRVAQVTPSDGSEYEESGRCIKKCSTDDSFYEWTLVHQELTSKNPQDESTGELRTYHDFVENVLYPYQKTIGIRDPEKKEAVYAYNQSQRELRKDLVKDFTGERQCGEPFREKFHELDQALRIPEDKKENCTEYEWMREGYRFMMPSYFKLIEHLVGTGRDFSVVFRTFGGDLGYVIAEHNLYCSGKHPLYPHRALHGTIAGRPDLRLVCPNNTGHFLRCGPRSEDLFLACTVGSSARSDTDYLPPLVQHLNGFESIWEHMQSKIERGERMFGYVDYYHYWHAAGEVASAGKLLLVDQEDPSVHPIFFDDNIDEDDPSIVDARDVRLKQELPFESTKDVYLVKVHPVEAILDPNYFVKKVKQCETSRRRRLNS